jgi:hypothetical protein
MGDAPECEGCGKPLTEEESRFCERCDDEWRTGYE